MNLHDRHIPMDNCPNLRQLGGYASQNGGTVKHGKLFRSGSLSHLSDEDQARLDALELSVIVDFRRTEEIQSKPNRLPKKLLKSQKQLNISPGSLNEIRGLQSPENMAAHMLVINQRLALKQEAPYREFLHTVLAIDRGGVLFHCAAGKDRTGFAAALILMALDIPRDTIMDDYLMSAKYFDPDAQAELLKQERSTTGLELSMPLDVLAPILSVKREYLQSAFDAIDSNFDNVETYFNKQYSFDRHKRQALQDKFLD